MEKRHEFVNQLDLEDHIKSLIIESEKNVGMRSSVFSIDILLSSGFKECEDRYHVLAAGYPYILHQLNFIEQQYHQQIYDSCKRLLEKHIPINSIFWQKSKEVLVQNLWNVDHKLAHEKTIFHMSHLSKESLIKKYSQCLLNHRSYPIFPFLSLMSLSTATLENEKLLGK